MKHIVKYFVMMFGLLCFIDNSASSFVNAMKGLGGDFKSFGETVASMGKGLGMSFGAPPTGYVYSYTVVNDTKQPIYVNTQEIASFMGAYFPKATGWSQATVLPMTQNFNVVNKDYYFEMSLHRENTKPESHLPYVNTEALYIQDCIQLPSAKHSTKMNYFHIYMGKKMEVGDYLHMPMAEYMGYANPSDPKDKNATVVISDVLTGSMALKIYNSTEKDLVVGYSSKKQAKSLQKSDCDLFLTQIDSNSFALRGPHIDATTKKGSLPLGTIGIFDQSDTTTEVFAMPNSVFGGQQYTLEIYQDNIVSEVVYHPPTTGEKVATGIANTITVAASLAGGQPQNLDSAKGTYETVYLHKQGPRSICIQALMSAHDVPSSRVRDITPVPCVFWNQSVAQLGQGNGKGMVDLPGQVWVVYKNDADSVFFQVPLGTAMQFDIIRPALDKQLWIYFVYVDVASTDAKGQQFIQKFIDGKIGSEIVAQYKEQGVKQFNEIQKELASALTFKPDAKNAKQDSKKIVVPESLLIAAIQGALKVNRGQIQDSDLNINGYLLGGDVFLPYGIGASSTLYYQLNPSQQTSKDVILPTSSVVNGFTMGISSAPKEMPTPIVYNAQDARTNAASDLAKSAKK